MNNNLSDESEVIRFRVFGEPREFPKKEIGFNPKTQQPVILQRDFQTRKDPFTKKTIRYNKGYKAAWTKEVQRQVLESMRRLKLEPFPRHHPIAMGCLFFLTPSDSNKRPSPTIAPDLDNYEYAVWNALGRSQKRTDKYKQYPKGILFYDDSQIVSRLLPCAKLWSNPAVEYARPGLIISVADASPNSIIGRSLMDMRYLEVHEQLALLHGGRLEA